MYVYKNGHLNKVNNDNSLMLNTRFNTNRYYVHGHDLVLSFVFGMLTLAKLTTNINISIFSIRIIY